MHINFDNFDAIIFDLDGTLINSEPLHEQALRTVLDQSGIKYDGHDLHETYFGQPDAMVFSSLLSKDEQDRVPALIESKNKALEKVIDEYDLQEFKELFTPGVEEFLNYLKSINKRIALASASEKIIVKATIEKANLENHFEFWLGREDTFCGKPGPAPYFLAMRKLGIPQHRILIFEDSPTGLTAAKLAGPQKVIRIATFAPNDKAAIFKEFESIANYHGLF